MTVPDGTKPDRPQNMPRAEVEIHASLVGALLRDQHPDLAALPIEPFAFGWDNVSFALGDHLLVRLPRRAAAAELIRHEQRWLEVIAEQVTLPLPVPVRTGRPALGYPWSWSVCPLLPGDPAPEPRDLDARRAAATLGRFVHSLHTEAPVDAPRNPFRGIPLRELDARLRGHLHVSGAALDAVRVLEEWDRLLQTPPWNGPPLWLHGDLHPANLLGADGDIVAVVDWGDITAGDPATDLGIAWMLLPAAARTTFREAARTVDEATWERGRGWALYIGVACVASSADNPMMHAIGARTVRAVLDDPAL